jgi:hypothetical protein
MSQQLPYGENTVVLNLKMVWPEDIARFPSLPAWQRLPLHEQSARELADWHANQEAVIPARLDHARKLMSA